MCCNMNHLLPVDRDAIPTLLLRDTVNYSFFNHKGKEFNSDWLADRVGQSKHFGACANSRRKNERK